MTTEEVTNACLEWAREVLPELLGGYDHMPPVSDQPLPDVAVEPQTVSIMQGSEMFPLAQLQQVWVRVFTMGFSFMVDNTYPGTAAQALRGFSDELTASLLGDGTLGGRVPFISNRIDFDFTPMLIERPDGTRGRELTLTMHVGELVQEGS